MYYNLWCVGNYHTIIVFTIIIIVGINAMHRMYSFEKLLLNSSFILFTSLHNLVPLCSAQSHMEHHGYSLGHYNFACTVPNIIVFDKVVDNIENELVTVPINIFDQYTALSYKKDRRLIEIIAVTSLYITCKLFSLFKNNNIFKFAH